MNFKVQRGVARPLLICAKEGGDHLKEELSLLQMLAENVTPRLWSDVKANKEREVLPCYGQDKKADCIHQSGARASASWKNPQWEHRISSEVNDVLAAGSFFSLYIYSLVNGDEMC